MREEEADRIAACKGGDEAAITELFERHYSSSMRVARGILRSEEESQDAVQSAYLSAFRHFGNFRGDSSFKTWITRIVTNFCLMRLREPSSRIHCVNVDDLDANGASAMLASREPTPETSAFQSEVASALADAAARLPKRLGEVFELHAFSGLTAKEVAAVTGLTLPATKTRLFRAQAQMRQHLEPVWTNTKGRRNAVRPGDRNGRNCEEHAEAA